LSFKTILLLSVINISLLRAQKCVDTVESSIGRILVFSNQTWRFYNSNDFDGIMNERVHEFMTKNQNFPYRTAWNNNSCFSGVRNDLSQLKDSIWVHVNGGESSAYFPPVSGAVTSTYKFRNGRYHLGIDLDLETGDTVYAAWSGKIRYAKYNEGGYGNLVVMRHPNSFETFYAHLSKILVYPNQEVKAGDAIGLGGNTGRSYGSHLHFEVRFYDATINPEEIINFQSKKIKKDSVLIHKALFRSGAKPSDEFFTAGDPDLVNEMITSEGTKDEQVVVKSKPIIKPKQAKYYSVRSGDTLSTIARKYNTTVSQLCKLNRIKTSSVLQLGKSLRVR